MTSRVAPPLDGIHESALYVRDLDRAATFYQEVLGFAEIGRDPRRHVFLRAGADILLLFDADVTRRARGGAPAHWGEGQLHVAFAVPPAALDAWRTRLNGHGVTIEAEVGWPRGGRSLYFRDPDGHSVELITRGVWQAAKDEHAPGPGIEERQS